jgi:hypothetical protein
MSMLLDKYKLLCSAKTEEKTHLITLSTKPKLTKTNTRNKQKEN